MSHPVQGRIWVATARSPPFEELGEAMRSKKKQLIQLTIEFDRDSLRRFSLRILRLLGKTTRRLFLVVCLATASGRNFESKHVDRSCSCHCLTVCRASVHSDSCSGGELK